MALRETLSPSSTETRHPRLIKRSERPSASLWCPVRERKFPIEPNKPRAKLIPLAVLRDPQLVEAANTDILAPLSVSGAVHHADRLDRKVSPIEAHEIISDGMNPTRIYLKKGKPDYLLLVRRLDPQETWENRADLNTLEVHDSQGNHKRTFFSREDRERLYKERGVKNLEDPRADMTDEQGRVRIGVTAILEEASSESGKTVEKYYPAQLVAQVTNHGSLTHPDGKLALQVFKTVRRRNKAGEWEEIETQGKNFTPLGTFETPEGPKEFALTRVDDGKNKRAISVVTIENNLETGEGILVEQSKLAVPEGQEPYWMTERFGTGGGLLRNEQGDPEVDLQENMTMLMHGQEMVNGKRVYRIGAVKVKFDEQGQWHLVSITKNHLVEKADCPTKELRPDVKDVTYDDDAGVLDNQGSVNVNLAAGDIKTFAVKFPYSAITSQLVGVGELKKRAAQLQLVKDLYIRQQLIDYASERSDEGAAR